VSDRIIGPAKRARVSFIRPHGGEDQIRCQVRHKATPDITARSFSIACGGVDGRRNHVGGVAACRDAEVIGQGGDRSRRGFWIDRR